MSLIVIKFGGEVAEAYEQLENLLISTKRLMEKKNKIVLIHGGGPSATELSKRLGIESKFVGGRRVTDLATLEVMKMTLPGVTNSNVLAACRRMGLPGVAVSGISLLEASKRPPKPVSGSNGENVDFGYVGDVSRVNNQLLVDLIEKNYLPIVSPLGCDQSGQVLNINADTVAVRIAQSMMCDIFVFIAAVGGVFQNLDDKNSRFQQLTVQESKEKIQNKTIQGGMIPKLEEAFDLLSGHLQSFHIVGVSSPDNVEKEILNPGAIGTAIVR